VATDFAAAAGINSNMNIWEEIQMQKSEQDQRSRARRRKVRDFFYHLVVFLFVLAILFVVSGMSGALVWLFLFWGFAVALHGVYAYFS
jgi:cytoskeletal protein RodZ